jgi:O-acetyl-ADP-ribose deacetylase (regulator of RNase III)
MSARQFGSLTVRIEQGDISLFDGDAVVNAANNHLILGAGVAGAIRRRGGPAVQEECNAHVRLHGPIRVGEAVVTRGGDLPARFVIHAAAMGDEPVSASSIRSATAHALELATTHGMSSLAFPVLGSGIGGFALEESARLMLEEIRRHGMGHTPVRDVALYGYSSRDASRLRAVLADAGADLAEPPDTHG